MKKYFFNSNFMNKQVLMNKSILQSLKLQQMKNSYLESSLKLSQLQARLTKNSYLSKGVLPSNLDAKVFLSIQRLKKTPNKQLHPQLYYWYIIMRQFSRKTLLAWREMEEDSEQDQLISEFIFEINNSIGGQINQKPQNQVNNCSNILIVVNTPKNSHRRKISQKNPDFNQNSNLSQKDFSKICQAKLKQRTPLNSIFVKNEFCSPAAEQQYIMEMQLFIENGSSLQTLKEKLRKEKVQILSFELEDDINLRVILRTDRVQSEQLKDRVSKWPEVSNIRFRKEKKVGGKLEIRSEKIIYSPIRKISFI